MSTPADELRTAAQTLMDLADAAQEELDTGDYWSGYDKATAWRDGFANGFGGVSSDLVAVFSPATAHALAAWLRAEAMRHERAASIGEFDASHDRPLAVARAINGQTAEGAQR